MASEKTHKVSNEEKERAISPENMQASSENKVSKNSADGSKNTISPSPQKIEKLDQYKTESQDEDEKESGTIFKE